MEKYAKKAKENNILKKTNKQHGVISEVVNRKNKKERK